MPTSLQRSSIIFLQNLRDYKVATESMAPAGPSDQPPSYDASISHSSSPPSTQSGEGKHPFLNPTSPRYLPLQVQLARARTERIKSALDEYIKPLLRSNAISGIHKTTLILIPFDVAQLRQQSPKESLVGLPKDTSLQLIRLSDSEGNLDFWRQRAVISEMAASLEAELDGWVAGSVPDPDPPNTSDSSARDEDSQVSPAGLPPRPQPSADKKFFWRRTRSLTGRPADPQHGKSELDIDFGLTWRTEEEKARDRGKVNGKSKGAWVDLAVKAVCLRVESDLGLYETRTGEGLSVDVELGL